MTPQEEIINIYKKEWEIKPTTRVWWTELVRECFEIATRVERECLKEEIEKRIVNWQNLANNGHSLTSLRTVIEDYQEVIKILEEKK